MPASLHKPGQGCSGVGIPAARQGGFSPRTVSEGQQRGQANPAHAVVLVWGILEHPAAGQRGDGLGDTVGTGWGTVGEWAEGDSVGDRQCGDGLGDSGRMGWGTDSVGTACARHPSLGSGFFIPLFPGAL